MIARLANVIYWTASGLAVLLLLFAAWGAFVTTVFKDDAAFIALMSGLLGVMIWAFGRAVLYVMAGR